MLRSSLLVLTLALAACGAASGAVSSAILNTSLAAGVAAIHRAEGKCVSTCTHGLVCNRATGYCESRPCASGCGPGQFCDTASEGGAMCREMTLLPGSRATGGPAAAPTVPPTR